MVEIGALDEAIIYQQNSKFLGISGFKGVENSNHICSILKRFQPLSAIHLQKICFTNIIIDTIGCYHSSIKGFTFNNCDSVSTLEGHIRFLQACISPVYFHYGNTLSHLTNNDLVELFNTPNSPLVLGLSDHHILNTETVLQIINNICQQQYLQTFMINNCENVDSNVVLQFIKNNQLEVRVIC